MRKAQSIYEIDAENGKKRQKVIFKFILEPVPILDPRRFTYYFGINFFKAEIN